jgi:hypothetical protein
MPLPHIFSNVARVLKLPLWACHLLAITGTSVPLFIMLHIKTAPLTGTSLACRDTNHCPTSAACHAQYEALSLGVSSA